MLFQSEITFNMFVSLMPPVSRCLRELFEKGVNVAAVPRAILVLLRATGDMATYT